MFPRVTRALPPIELAYAEITASPTDSTAAINSAVAIPGLSITVYLPAAPVVIAFFSPYVYNLTANKGVAVEIWDTTAAAKVGEAQHWSGVAAEMDAVKIERRYNPGAGTRTFEVRRSTNGGGTAHVHAQTTAPAFLTAQRL